MPHDVPPSASAAEKQPEPTTPSEGSRVRERQTIADAARSDLGGMFAVKIRGPGERNPAREKQIVWCHDYWNGATLWISNQDRVPLAVNGRHVGPGQSIVAAEIESDGGTHGLETSWEGNVLLVTNHRQRSVRISGQSIRPGCSLEIRVVRLQIHSS